ncbi:MAG: CoA-binding protein [Deltaproteobacteria bacterium]|nr:CoA-binding protein [Deltaproteobacteria bacterium]MBI3295620.1 CoA-binding protein [Deltaproteobacteria bacterium]
MKTIAIIGASRDRSKFGNKAVRVFIEKGYTVYPVNPKEIEIEGLKVYRSILEVPETHLDMVSLYLPPPLGLQAVEDISQKKVGELWLNPGSASDELVEKAEGLGLTVIQACSIVGVGGNPNV